MKTFFYSLIAFVFLLVASPVNAQEPTFEPSRFITCEGAGCSACNLVEMANEIIVWLFGIIFLLFAVLMTVAGFGLVTSGGNPSALNAAKDKFTNAMIGLLIVMSAWLIVDTLMQSLLKDVGEIDGFGPWATVKCQVQAEPNEPVPGDPGSGGTGGTGGTGSTTASSTCPIKPLAPITDPLALRMERGETVIWDNTHPELRRCAERKAGSIDKITSAYRPQSYQDHLYSVWYKWCKQGLRDNTTAACSEVKSAVGAEMNHHQLSCNRLVASKASSHKLGLSVDISGVPHNNSHCLRWYGPDDDVHYTYMGGGCTCN